MSVVVGEEEVFDNYRGGAMFTPLNRHTQVSFPCDSGANVRIIPWNEDSGNTRTFRQ